MAFSDAELERYARHIILREIGGAGQQRLKSARVLCIGAGGLGAPALLYLAATAKVAGNDLLNARQVIAQSTRADIRINNDGAGG